MKTFSAVLLTLTALTTPVSAQSINDQATVERRFAIRGFGLVTEQSFSAPATFDAIFGSATGPFFGGGAQVVHRSGLYAEFSASRFQETGERAFRSDGQSFQLGIPLTATVTPVEFSGGYRIRLGRQPRIVPYAGAGVGSYGYQEVSEGSEGLDVRHTGYLAVGGVEMRALRWIAVTVDAQYTHIPGILGAGGVSRGANEDDLGGMAIRFRVVLGR